jgi:catechol 2,3-dioxygenase-like lactoylglutathione lyase family enzyme
MTISLRTRLRIALPLLAAAVLAVDAAAQPGAPACAAPADSVRLRLDHVPIAVRDLDVAVRTFGALGFSFKPGRPHENSILNQHVKFADGSALELITATEPRDDLARYYRDFLARGEGGAFLSLDAGPVAPISAGIRSVEPDHRATTGAYYQSLSFQGAHPMRYLFFILIQSRPPDLPEHLSHANGAARLAAVWVRRHDPSHERRLLERLGARACPSALRLPVGAVMSEMRLERGSLYLVPSPGAAPARAVTGVTIEVPDLAAARRAVALPDTAVQRGRDPRGEWLRIPPAHAHGIWIELLRPASRR